MLKAWQAADTFDPARPLAPWLFTIVRHCAIDIARRERRHRIESLDASESEPAAIATDGFERAWEAWTVQDALRTLPDEEHSVMRLAYYEDFTHSEIAARAGDPDRNGQVALGPCARTPPLAARTAFALAG